MPVIFECDACHVKAKAETLWMAQEMFKNENETQHGQLSRTADPVFFDYNQYGGSFVLCNGCKKMAEIAKSQEEARILSNQSHKIWHKIREVLKIK